MSEIAIQDLPEADAVSDTDIVIVDDGTATKSAVVSLIRAGLIPKSSGSVASDYLADESVTTDKLADESVTTDKLADSGASAGSYTNASITIDSKGRVTAASSGGGAVPVGTVIWFAAASPPSGWLSCAGTIVSRTTYADLFSVIGTTFGAGDGSTTFVLPDLRGEFVRGYDGGRLIDTGRVFGSTQGDALQGHKHTFDLNNSSSLAYGGTAVGATGVTHTAAGSTSVSLAADGTNGTPRTAAETRPTNVALLPCIKH